MGRTDENALRRPEEGSDKDAFRKHVVQFLASEIKPYYSQWEKDRRIPRDAWTRAGRAGLLCRTAPVEYGGGGSADFSSAAVIIEEICRLKLNGFMTFLHSDIAVPYLLEFGSSRLQKKHIRACVTGETIVAIAITEAHSGSDVNAMKTLATPVDGGFRLSGEKTHISFGCSADFAIVAAKVRLENAHDGGGIGLFMVDLGEPGVARKPIDKVGLLALDTARITFDGLFVPKAQVIGSSTMGLVYLMKMLAVERLVLAVGANASAQEVLRQLVLFCRERRTSECRIIDYQNTRFQLADLWSSMRTNADYIDRRVFDHQRRCLDPVDASVAKLMATELLKKVTTIAVQLRGASSIVSGQSSSGAQDLIDSCIQTIWGGASEVMRAIIGDNLEAWALR